MEAEDIRTDHAKHDTHQPVIAKQWAESCHCLRSVVPWALMHSTFLTSCVAWVSLLQQLVLENFSEKRGFPVAFNAEGLQETHICPVGPARYADLQRKKAQLRLWFCFLCRSLLPTL